jgi:hypothetical protein
MNENENENDHVACVDAWRARVDDELSRTALLLAYERGFGAVWERARLTLGDVTLMAIGDRVLHDGIQQYPLLSALRLEPTGISCEDLAHEVEAIDANELDAAFTFLLVELLTVLGRLTAEVLTPALHAALEADQGSAP